MSLSHSKGLYECFYGAFKNANHPAFLDFMEAYNARLDPEGTPLEDMLAVLEKESEDTHNPESHFDLLDEFVRQVRLRPTFSIGILDYLSDRISDRFYIDFLDTVQAETQDETYQSSGQSSGTYDALAESSGPGMREEIALEINRSIRRTLGFMASSNVQFPEKDPDADIVKNRFLCLVNDIGRNQTFLDVIHKRNLKLQKSSDDVPTSAM